MSFTLPKVNWVELGWGYRADTVDQLQYAVGRVGTYQQGRRFVWRGVDDATYAVVSSLYRHAASHQDTEPTEDDLKSWELAFLRAARDWDLGMDVDNYPTDLHLLAKLQHEGVPTRLLDVTSNPQTALWFACASNSHGAGVLMAFDVTDWPRVDTADTLRATWGGLEGRSALEVRLTESAAEQAPFLVLPRRPTGRLAAQEGLFWTSAVPAEPQPGFVGVTLGRGIEPVGVDSLNARFAIEQRQRGRPGHLPFCAIIIPPVVKRSMLSHLSGTYNRKRSTLFPDVGGFAAAVRLGEIRSIEIKSTTAELQAEVHGEAN